MGLWMDRLARCSAFCLVVLTYLFFVQHRYVVRMLRCTYGVVLVLVLAFTRTSFF